MIKVKRNDQALVCQGKTEGGLVTVWPEPRNDSPCLVGQVRVVTKTFPLVDVGQMHFDIGNVHACQGIPQRNAGMRIGCSIDNDEIGLVLTGSLDAIDEPAFVITLKRRALRTIIGGNSL